MVYANNPGCRYLGPGGVGETPGSARPAPTALERRQSNVCRLHAQLCKDQSSSLRREVGQGGRDDAYPLYCRRSQTAGVVNFGGWPRLNGCVPIGLRKSRMSTKGCSEVRLRYPLVSPDALLCSPRKRTRADSSNGKIEIRR